MKAKPRVLRTEAESKDVPAVSMDSNLLKTYVRVKRIPKGQRSAFKKLVERLLESAARKRNAIAICDEAHEVLFKKKLSVDAAEYGLIRCDSP